MHSFFMADLERQQAIPTEKARALVEDQIGRRPLIGALSESDRDRLTAAKRFLHKYEPRMFRRAVIRTSSRFPGTRGDFSHRASQIESMAGFNRDAIKFIKDHGDLYASGGEEDLEKFFIERDKLFRKYEATLRPYVSRKRVAVTRAAINTVFRVFFELYAWTNLQLGDAVVGTHIVDWKKLGKQEFRTDWNSILNFLYTDKLLKPGGTVGQRLARLHAVTDASHDLHNEYVGQYRALTDLIATEALNSRFSGRAQYIRHYQVPLNDPEIEGKVKGIIEEMGKPPQEGKVITHKETAFDWNDYLKIRNLSVRLETEIIDGEERKNLRFGARYPKGIKMWWRKAKPQWIEKFGWSRWMFGRPGWIGTNWHYFSRDNKIPLPENGRPLSEEHADIVKHLFTIMNIPHEEASVPLTAARLEQIFKEHGYVPKTNYERTSRSFELGKDTEIIINTDQKSSEPGKNPRLFGRDSLTIAVPKDRKERPSLLMRLVEKLKLKKSKAGLHELV